MHILFYILQPLFCDLGCLVDAPLKEVSGNVTGCSSLFVYMGNAGCYKNLFAFIGLPIHAGNLQSLEHPGFTASFSFVLAFRHQRKHS